MGNNYSQNLLELAKNEHVPETAQIWAEWSIQTALDKEIQKYRPPTERDNLDDDERYNAREPTTSEE